MTSSHPRRILFVEPVAHRGGAEVVLLDLLAGLDRTRFTPHVALLAEGPLADEVRALDVPVWCFPEHRVRQLVTTARAVLWLVTLTRRLAIDLIHCQGTKTHFYSGLARALTGVAELWHIYDPPADPPSWIDTMTTRIPTSRLLFISDASRNGFAPFVDTRTGVVIHPGTRAPTPVDAPEIVQARRAVGLPEDASYILQVARLQHFKGQDLLVEAMSRVSQRFPHLHAVMVGATLFGLEPEYPAQVRDRIAASGMEKVIHMPGGVSDSTLAALMTDATLVCYAERRGPWSLVILEAMARGKPVVASRTAGSEAAVIDGVTGRIVPPDDAGALALAIEEAVGSPERGKSWGAAGRDRWSAHFTVQATVSKTQDLYDEILIR